MRALPWRARKLGKALRGRRFLRMDALAPARGVRDSGRDGRSGPGAPASLQEQRWESLECRPRRCRSPRFLSHRVRSSAWVAPRKPANAKGAAQRYRRHCARILNSAVHGPFDCRVTFSAGGPCRRRGGGRQEERAEAAGEHPDGQEEARPAGEPAVAGRGGPRERTSAGSGAVLALQLAVNPVVPGHLPARIAV